VPIALLETKLYVPRSRRDLVLRPRLSERLDRGTASKLVLVSAPAGFGKTTLITEWLAARPAALADERLAAWLSLDRGDNDPASFWAYVIAALRTVSSGVGESALALLDAPQPPAIETVLTTLLNDLGAVAGEIVLVLDDYHVIDAREVQDGMAFLLDHLMYRSRLVPRVIPVIGLIGAPLLIASVFATMFGGIEQYSSLAALAALPVAVWEFSLGVWLVIKGFKPSPITTGMAAAGTSLAEGTMAV
jgi:hypothetical protein